MPARPLLERGTELLQGPLGRLARVRLLAALEEAKQLAAEICTGTPAALAQRLAEAQALLDG